MRIILAILLSILSTLTYAGVGSVVELTGLAIIKRGKETITVVKGTEIEMNDRVETKNGKVKIEFKDKTTVTVTEHSALIIDDFVYDPKSSSGKLSIKAAEGTVRYVSGAIAKNDPKNVNIKTPTATIAVRGTDFVMSVNEVGSSMVILMPSCEGTSCINGIIDVNTGFGSVTMDKPYQATMAEGGAAPPTPPVIVNLSNSPIGNNLHIAPPASTNGANVVAAAREAAAKTGDIVTSPVNNQEAQVKQDKPATTSQQAVKETKTETSLIESVNNVIIPVTVEMIAETVNQPAEENKSESSNTNVKKIWADASQNNQIGWLYERLNGNNYANVKVPLDSKLNVISVQNRQMDSFNFSLIPGQGTIIINQVYR